MLPSTIMFRRDRAPKHGCDERLKYTSDWLFDIELFRNGCVVPINEVLGRYRRHSNNATSSPSLRAIAFEEGLLVLAIATARYPELYELARRRRAGLILVEAARAKLRGDTRRFRHCVRMAMAEGAWFRAASLYVGLQYFSPLLASEAVKEVFHQQRWFVRMSNLIRKG
jgi:hypothetical protein